MDGKNGEGVKCIGEAQSHNGRVSFQIAFTARTKCGRDVYSEGQHQTKDLSAGPSTLEPGLVLASVTGKSSLIKIQFLTMLAGPSGIYMYLFICTQICLCATTIQDLLKSVSIIMYLCFD